MTEEVVLKSKEIIFRGKNLSDLKKLDVRESAKYLPSRSRRSILRNFQAIESFIKKCEAKIAKKKKIRTQRRDIIIVPKMVGMTISIHDGKHFKDVELSAGMIGHRLGEFAMTRTKVVHGAAGIGATKGTKTEKK